MADNKLYGVLGVNQNASDAEIKKSYRRLAKEFHPDKFPEAIDIFKQISFAYEVLSDPEKRRTYNRYGLKGLQEGMDGGDDILNREFGSFFSDMGGMGARRQKCEDKIMQQMVKLEDLYMGGKTFNLEIERVVICNNCDGRGGKVGAAKSCRSCRGTGTRVTIQHHGSGISQQINSRCPDCSGIGEKYNDHDRCNVCRGNRTKEEKKVLDVHVDKGMQNMQKIVFREEGNQIPGCDKGNVIVVLVQAPHSTFQRSGNDLVIKHKLTITEALCGFNIPLKHLDDRQILIQCKPGDIIKQGALKVVKGEGMPVYKNPFERGNLYIKFDIEFPENNFATVEQMEQLELLLPPRPMFIMPEGDDVEEVAMYDYDLAHDGDRRDETYDSDDDNHGERGNVQCASQ